MIAAITWSWLSFALGALSVPAVYLAVVWARHGLKLLKEKISPSIEDAKDKVEDVIEDVFEPGKKE